MKPEKLYVFLCLIMFSLISYGQPANYTPGTQVCWQFNGADHGYFKAAGSGERHILVSFVGDGQPNCASMEAHSPQKLLKDAGFVNWDGKTVRGPNDTIIWEVFTLPITYGNWYPAYAADIEYFLTHIGSIDTSDHSKFHIMGISGGAQRMWGYLTNTYSHNSEYRKIFSTTISESAPWATPSVSGFGAGLRHWVWHGAADTLPANQPKLTPPEASQSIYDNLSGHKRITIQQDAGHDDRTWDSCMSLAGSDTNTSRWYWMINANKIDDTPTACNLGGPANYTAGTQVCWTYNGNPHGYFRAAGNGERHILIAFTDDAQDDCSDYQINSPQKLLEDAGINWNGRTIRAPGDTVVWEVLTIVNTHGNWIPVYAADIAYFFANICPIDTSDHSKIHIMGLGGGVARMWNYLINAQSHNSDYRNVFSTTISLSSPWLSSMSDISTYSAGRRHWVWHGEDETYPTPAAAGQLLYDNLQGDKQLTIQDDGLHDAATFDSCMSLNDVDTFSSRWLWMTYAVGSGSLRVNNGELLEEIIPAKQKLTLYPNPAKSRVVIGLPVLSGACQIKLLDMNGRQHRLITNVSSPIYQLDVSGLSPGVYIIQVDSKSYRLQTKFVKE